MSYENLLFDCDKGVATITLNRVEALNALNAALLAELEQALDQAEADAEIGAVIITGSDKAFAAGADVKEMSEQSMQDMTRTDAFGKINAAFARTRKPIIAAVAGYALGGGCELAMACDMLIAADNAKFGQPEIKLGVIPGIGGTQRLTKLVGKAKAMDMMLTGRMMDAEEAERAGLVSRVVAADDLLETALDIAASIAALSAPSVAAAKETTNRALEVGLTEGLLFERRVFYSLFATEDQKEGMAAFIDKRQPHFKNA